LDVVEGVERVETSDHYTAKWNGSSKMLV
jgi:hypothetical protein